MKWPKNFTFLSLMLGNVYDGSLQYTETLISSKVDPAEQNKNKVTLRQERGLSGAAELKLTIENVSRFL